MPLRASEASIGAPSLANALRSIATETPEIASSVQASHPESFFDIATTRRPLHDLRNLKTSGF